ncbi:MAG TPA: class I SAM-dependent methyltransferase, partial [Dehalococcoidia bacterium]
MLKGVDDLLRAGPVFHTDSLGRPYSGHLGEEALLYLWQHLTPASRTLEVGAGYSTVVFAMTGAEHVVVTPNQAEVDAIEAFCTQEEVSLERVRFVVEDSGRVLPAMAPDPQFDLVLIDGSHAYPMPALDWHYASKLLKTGGLLLLDDTEIWSVRTLRDFLKQDLNWRFEAGLCIGRTAVFRKLSDARPSRFWADQPYVVARSDLSLVVFRNHRL